MWNYKKTSNFDIGSGYGVLEYDFFTINDEEEFWSLIDFYRALWLRFDYFLDGYKTIENNTGLSIHVQEIMREHDANLCLTSWEEESQKNTIKTREMIVNKQKDDGSYDTFVFHFYFLNRNNVKKILEQAFTSEQKFHKATIAYFSEAIRLMPEDAALYVYRGNERSKIGDFDSALEDYNKAIKIKAGCVSAYINRGIAYGNKRCFGEAIEINPENDGGYLARGYVYQEKADLENAKADFLKALEISPYNFAAKKALEQLPQ